MQFYWLVSAAWQRKSGWHVRHAHAHLRAADAADPAFPALLHHAGKCLCQGAVPLSHARFACMERSAHMHVFACMHGAECPHPLHASANLNVRVAMHACAHAQTWTGIATCIRHPEHFACCA
eukprot:363892-Chlamydomonas_euryale.AAC.6